MKIIITATTDKGKKAIESNKALGKQKNTEFVNNEKMIITIPTHLAIPLRLIKKKLGIEAQYDDFIKTSMKSHGATEKDYTYKVE